jgi:thermitase
MKHRLTLPPFVYLALTAGLLSSCGNQVEPILTTTVPGADQYVITVAVTNTDTVASLEAQYQGHISAFHPDSGFAVLSTNQSARGSSVRSVGNNIDALTNPEEDEAEALGLQAWASGLQAWASGSQAWASSWTTLANGASVPNLPNQNIDMFKRIGLTEAHAIAKQFGAGIKVAVIDTGADIKHPALVGSLAPSSEWRDYVDNDLIPNDEPGLNATPGNAYGHGTAVSGIILQVAPKATILPLRVLDSKGKGNMSNIVKAIDYAITSGANVINLSLGAVKPDLALTQEIAYAKTKGVYMIAAAGNNGKKDGANYPAKDSKQDNMIGYLFGIGSINDTEVISSFSSSGEGVIAYAPGEKIYTLLPNNRVGFATGTSFATPLVSGAFALAMSELSNVADRSKLGNVFDTSLEADRIWNKFYSATPTAPWQYGNGALEIERLILKLPNYSLPSTQSNLLSNPGFENASLENWKLTDSSVVTGQARTGSKALQLNSSTAQSANIQLTNLLPNKTYTYFAWVKTATPNRDVCIAAYAFTNDSVLDNLSGACTNSPQNYTLISTRFTTDASHSSVVLNASFVGLTSGTAYVDDAVIFASP